ncbi:MAG: hypothetical protein ACOYXT_14875 [Bacteroidota bacterium]
MTKALGTLAIVFICILLFPIGIGIIGGVFGIVIGVLGAVFGAIAGIIGGIFGAIFGVIGWAFDGIFGWDCDWHPDFFHGNVWTIALVIIIVALITRKRK